MTLFISEALSKQEYRGRCKYGNSIKCSNERALKMDGEAHKLCKNHRNLHNEYQRKSDRKRRAFKRSTTMSPNAPYQHRAVRPSITRSSSLSLSMDNIMPTPLSEMTWSSSTSSFEAEDHWQWSAEEINFLQIFSVEEPMDLNPQTMNMLPAVKGDLEFHQ